MSKCLESLERLKNTLLAEGYWQDVLEDVSIIENALNQYYRLLKEDDETTKKLKALDIIKTKKVDIKYLYYRAEFNVEKYNDNYIETLTKEECDLLKEVLL